MDDAREASFLCVMLMNFLMSVTCLGYESRKGQSAKVTGGYALTILTVMQTDFGDEHWVWLKTLFEVRCITPGDCRSVPR